MDNMKKIYLITHKERRPYHLKNLERRYRNKIQVTDILDDADIAICIGLDREHADYASEQEILQAERMNIPLHYFSDELLPYDSVSKILKTERELPYPGRELAFRGEELEQ
ncbi:hypothetical protein K280104A7_33260 [Candidatus Bariatricus faecipullorum]